MELAHELALGSLVVVELGFLVAVRKLELVALEWLACRIEHEIVDETGPWIVEWQREIELARRLSIVDEIDLAKQLAIVDEIELEWRHGIVVE